MEWLKTRLVDDCRDFLRWWSVRMTLIGGIIGGVLTAMPSMPPEVQTALPVKYRVAALAIWTIASLAARVAKQPDKASGQG
jgi:hypothetical protein